MNYWSLYFIFVAVLHFAGSIHAIWWLNFPLACATLWPVRQRRDFWIKQILLALATGSLLYRESYLPSLKQGLSQLSLVLNFSVDYLLELAGRLYNPKILFAVCAGFLGYELLHRRIRFATFAFLAIFAVALQTVKPEWFVKEAPVKAIVATGNAGQGDGLDSLLPPAETSPKAGTSDASARLAAFYAEEAKRRVEFPAKQDTTAPFDVVILHICSLAWDDLDFVEERNNPFFNQFDFIFSRFNTAASYSGPASLRVLYGACGQKPHSGLYGQIDERCKVFVDLENMGLKSYAVLNHDGSFDSFAQTLQDKAGFKGRLTINKSAPIHMSAFDGAPIYDDYAVLSSWYEEHTRKPEGSLALYYNTISLHDGNRVPGLKSNRSTETFKPRIRKLFADFERFIEQIEKKGRPTVLLLIPEHGAALRGDSMQIPGMREIPTPKITQVPAAIKLIGLQRDNQKTVTIDQPISYLGVYTILSDMLKQSPFRNASTSYMIDPARIEKTPIVSENGEVVMMQNTNGEFLMLSGNGAWVPYKDKE